MIESLHVKKPLYPLLSIVAAFAIVIEGLFMAKSMKVFIFMAALCVLYITFGYGKILFKILLIFIPISLFMGAISTLTSGREEAMVQIFARIVLVAMSSVTMISTPPIALTRALTMLKFPRILILGMLVTVRFIPVLRSEAKQILEAMKTRGVNNKLSNMYRGFLIPFIMRIINMSDIMSLSIETRGFDLASNEASVYKEVRFGKRDLLYTVLLVAIMVVVLVL